VQNGLTVAKSRQRAALAGIAREKLLRVELNPGSEDRIKDRSKVR
jgi:hypothetical protein